ncbi:BafA family autotransporter [Bartonella sp. B30(2025)]
MRYKCKLGFSILMINGCLVQIVDADESKRGELKRIGSGAGGYSQVNSNIQVPKGSALITNLFSSNTTISSGGVEVVDQGSSLNATVEKDGMQIVTRGGSATNTKILGGQQFVFEEKSFTRFDNDAIRRSTASEAIVSGTGGSIGQQNVYDGGHSWKTKVSSGGEQNLYTGNKRAGGVASNTTVSGTGRQHVLEKGKAIGTTLQDHAIQVVYSGGEIDGLTIGGYASAWIHSGAKISGGVTVNSHGHLYLYASDSIDHIKKEKLSIENRAPEEFFSVGMRDDKNSTWFRIHSLSGEGGNVSFVTIPYDPRHLSLHVNKLSGRLHFHFNLDTAKNKRNQYSEYNKYDRTNQHSNYLLISEGKGNHTVSVADSGVEITNFFSQEKDFFPRIELITDRSSGEGANFTLVNHSGNPITSVDSGTFIYGLYKGKKEVDKSGYYVFWYLGVKQDDTELLNTHFRSSNKGRRNENGHVSWKNFRSQSGGSTSRASSSGQSRGQTARSRPPRHLREKQDDKNETSSFDNASNTSVSLIDQIIERPNGQSLRLPQEPQEIRISDFLTSPSTDAVLSMSVVPGIIFYNELQAVRAGRGIINGSQTTSSFWTQAIKHKEHIATGHIDFKLDQTGIILGVNGLSELMSGEFYIGGFGSYDQARVAHARKGTSSINSYSVGAYATYFDYSGWYLDAVLKYNNYQNDLNAVSTNGLDIHGNYNQWAVGASLETGYRFKLSQQSWMRPYGGLTWLQVANKEIKLSNGMMGDLSRLTSLQSEVGVSVGYEFGSDTKTPSVAYIMASWVRENITKNYTTINKQHKFITDLSGHAGKLGIGLNSSISDRLMVFAEASYLQGQKIKQSFQGTLGLRYTF